MRKIYSLDKDWKFSDDIKLKKNKIEDYFGMFSSYTKTGVTSGPSSTGYFDNDWETVNLPHDYTVTLNPVSDSDGGEGFRKQTCVWYRKCFALPEECENKRIFLKFDSIAISSDIYVNSIKVSNMPSAYTQIYTEITECIEKGKQIFITVRADNLKKEGWWYEGCGIYGHAYLIACDDDFIKNDGAFLHNEKAGDKWRINLSCEIEKKSENLTLALDIPELNIHKSVPAEPLTKITAETENPTLWDTENPYLYTAYVRLYKGDTLVCEDVIKTGFRECVFDSEKGFFLNGKSMKLKGVCMHHDHAGVGTAIPRAVLRYRVKRLKEMGVNAIRTSHNPRLPEFYEICDENGILVMNETRHFSPADSDMHTLTSFVRRCRNHPCVIMWSMFNEEPLQCSFTGEKIARKMKNAILSLDPTRPVTGGMNGTYEREGVVKAVDLMGFNYLQYGYEDFHKLHPEIPIFGSETGSYVTNRGETETDMTKLYRSCCGREMNVNLLKWSDTPGGTWKHIASKPYVMGGFYWTGMDYKGECSKFPANAASFGAMDLCGFKKDNFYWHKVLWDDTPDLYISPHWNFSGDTARIICYSNCDELKYFVNGREIKTEKNDVFDPILTELPYERGTLTVKGYINGREVCEKSVSTYGALHHLEEEVFTGEDAVLINYYACDKDGNFVYNADSLVDFKANDAEIIGVGNGDASSAENDKEHFRKLYNGCVQVILKPAQEFITVTASVEGIAENVVNITHELKDEREYIPSEIPKIRCERWQMSDVSADYPEERYIGNLMYAWIPTMTGYGTNLMLSGKQGYGIIAGNIMIPKKEGNFSVVFSEIEGKCDMYFGKTFIKTLGDGTHKNVKITIPKDYEKPSEIISAVFEIKGNPCGITKDVYIEED